MTTLDDLWEIPQDGTLPWLDREGAEPETWLQQFWQTNGYVIMEGLIPEPLIDTYVEGYPEGGYGIGTPYLQSGSLRDVALYGPLMDAMADLVGEKMSLHLNLTYWRSTQRGWHQDTYLNPDEVCDFYAASWVALDDIDVTTGPFEFVPGTHRWPAIRKDKMLAAMGEDGSDPDWPWRSERLLSPLIEDRLWELGLKVERFLGLKGDVLIWHPRLVHRGAVPINPARERRALISHYSGLHHRTDFARAERHVDGGHFFVPRGM